MVFLNLCKMHFKLYFCLQKEAIGLEKSVADIENTRSETARNIPEVEHLKSETILNLAKARAAGNKTNISNTVQ